MVCSTSYRPALTTLCNPLPPARPVVLSIDDDPDISAVLQRRLSARGVEVIGAYHGMQGFWLASTRRPGVIITDLNMPQGRGDYVVECLKRNSNTAHIPVIVLSGRWSHQERQRLWKLGIEEFLAKPIDFQVLCEALARFIIFAPESE